MVVPDWRAAPPGIFDSWEKTARWVLEHMPAQRVDRPKDARLR